MSSEAQVNDRLEIECYNFGFENWLVSFAAKWLSDSKSVCPLISLFWSAGKVSLVCWWLRCFFFLKVVCRVPIVYRLCYLLRGVLSKLVSPTELVFADGESRRCSAIWFLTSKSLKDLNFEFRLLFVRPEYFVRVPS